MRRLGLLSMAAMLMTAGSAAAQMPNGALKIGILSDQSGIYSSVTGRGTVEAVKLAVEDAGGKVLGVPIEVLAADDQNKADVSAATARKWIDEDKVDVILAGGGSAPTIAVLAVTKEKNKTLLISGAGSSDLTGKLCSLTSTHWAFDTYGLASTVAKAVVADGGKTWFFITADYSFGQALERDATHFIQAGGGKVVGTARYPVGASDFSSYLLSARGSGASTIGLANAGSDLVNAIKQAQEFGIPEGGQRLAGLLLYVNDIQALGLAAARGAVGATSFYHDQSDATQAWTARYMAHYPGEHVPNMVQAGACAADIVGKKMRELPVSDFYDNNVRIRRDGRVLQNMMLWQAKLPSESKGPYDLLSIRKTIPGTDVFRPEGEGGCPLVAK